MDGQLVNADDADDSAEIGNALGLGNAASDRIDMIPS